MRTKFVILLLTLVALVGLSGGYVVTGLQAYSRYQQNSAANAEHCGGQTPVHVCVRTPTAVFSAFYPMYVANEYPLFMVDYSSTTPITLLVSVGVVGLTGMPSTTVNATSTVQSVSITPPLNEQSF